MRVIRCNHCYWIGRDGETALRLDGYGKAETCCPVCKKADALMDATAECSFTQENLKESWKLFGDVSINDDDEIFEDFLDFPTGANRFDVWHWFESKGFMLSCAN